MTLQRQALDERRAMWHGRKTGTYAHGRRLHNLNHRVKYLEEALLRATTPWPVRLWRWLLNSHTGGER